MHQCSKNAKLGKIVELGGKATCTVINIVYINQTEHFILALAYFPKVSLSPQVSADVCENLLMTFYDQVIECADKIQSVASPSAACRFVLKDTSK